MERDGTGERWEGRVENGERWDGREMGRESREWSKVVRNCRIGSNPMILNIQVYLFAFNFFLLINLYHIIMMCKTITHTPHPESLPSRLSLSFPPLPR